MVEIEGLDSNMCCGTHVPNLSHLQVSRGNTTFGTELIHHHFFGLYSVSSCSLQKVRKGLHYCTTLLGTGYCFIHSEHMRMNVLSTSSSGMFSSTLSQEVYVFTNTSTCMMQCGFR